MKSCKPGLFSMRYLLLEHEIVWVISGILSLTLWMDLTKILNTSEWMLNRYINFAIDDMEYLHGLQGCRPKKVGRGLCCRKFILATPLVTPISPTLWWWFSIIDCLSSVSCTNDIRPSIKKIQPLVRLWWKARAVNLYKVVIKGCLHRQFRITNFGIRPVYFMLRGRKLSPPPQELSWL